MLTRFDFTKNERDLLNTAVSCGLVDPVGLACIVASHANSMDAIISKLSEICWTLRTGSDAEQETRSRWIDACDYFRFIDDDQG
tara:strand:- start:552 stop:803 length:252 start_codon:yes stop_codon:yes gene_type:complete